MHFLKRASGARGARGPQAARGGLAGVGEQVVGLAEGLAVEDEVARDLVALQGALARHVIQLHADAPLHLRLIAQLQGLCAKSPCLTPTQGLHDAPLHQTCKPRCMQLLCVVVHAQAAG